VAENVTTSIGKDADTKGGTPTTTASEKEKSTETKAGDQGGAQADLVKKLEELEKRLTEAEAKTTKAKEEADRKEKVIQSTKDSKKTLDERLQELAAENQALVAHLRRKSLHTALGASVQRPELVTRLIEPQDDWFEGGDLSEEGKKALAAFVAELPKEWLATVAPGGSTSPSKPKTAEEPKRPANFGKHPFDFVRR
jgi:hypothetical protein